MPMLLSYHDYPDLPIFRQLNTYLQFASALMNAALQEKAATTEKVFRWKVFSKKNWEEIAETMKQKILSISGPQCAAKMQSLKKTYKSVKYHNTKSAKTWSSPVAVTSLSGIFNNTEKSKSEALSEEQARAKRHKERVDIDEKVLALLSKLVDKK
ncbi:hypothetical protein RN001_007628 [Aquatica leii]|uniref:Myb/SANT-like DNA-binding domain-containing protein n=1 Tax=Aquatica leii TaxID=1421715 RepID=A0AAN7SFJ1_9COLE|nr:hypothetical protein RN001_007628 [Aquatica leii]